MCFKYLHMCAMHAKCFSHVQLSVKLWTVAHWAPLSMGFSRQEYWSGLYALLQGIFPTKGLNPGLPHCRRILYRLSHQGMIVTSSHGIREQASRVVLVVKNSPAKAGDLRDEGLIPESGSSHKRARSSLLRSITLTTDN